MFAGEAIGGEIRPQPDEVIDIRYFSISNLPPDMLLGSRHRVLDAARGVGGSIAVCEDFPWAFDEAKTRKEIYALRDQQPDVPRAELYAQYISGIDHTRLRVEVGE